MRNLKTYENFEPEEEWEEEDGEIKPYTVYDVNINVLDHFLFRLKEKGYEPFSDSHDEMTEKLKRTKDRVQVYTTDVYFLYVGNYMSLPSSPKFINRDIFESFEPEESSS